MSAFCPPALRRPRGRLGLANGQVREESLRLIMMVSERIGSTRFHRMESPTWTCASQGCTASRWLLGPGHVGVASRSGGMTSSTGYYLSRAGVGLATLVHVGGDGIVGLPLPA